jgi:hypothetical protein
MKIKIELDITDCHDCPCYHSGYLDANIWYSCGKGKRYDFHKEMFNECKYKIFGKVKKLYLI